MNAALERQPHLFPALEGAMAQHHLGTAQHSIRVARMAHTLGEHLGLGVNDLEAVLWAGILHDIGKLGVSEAILAKPGPLTDVQWAEIKRHPAVGSDLLVLLSAELAPIAAGVRSHHERWDGSGYPDGLAGEDIPYFGRILTVTDVYDSVTHRRSYRANMFTVADARSLLDEHTGSHFDPTVVATFLELQAAGRFDV